MSDMAIHVENLGKAWGVFRIAESVFRGAA
jgi:hypothetical protein